MKYQAHGCPQPTQIAVADIHAGQADLAFALQQAGQVQALEHLPAAEDVYAMWPHLNVSTHTARVRYAYSSPVTPKQVLEIDLRGNTTRLLKQDRVGGGYNSENFRTQRRWVTARDGARVPVSTPRASAS